MLSFKQYILVEAKIDDYKAQETVISTAHDPEAKFKKPADIIDHFHKHSPGGNVQHTRWMIDRYKKGEMKQEDAPDMKETLSNFDKYKPNLAKKRVEQYKSISDLKTAIHPFKEQDEAVKNVNQKKIDEGSTIVHNSPNITAYHVHTTEAAQELGKTPKGEKLGWCTSHPDRNQNMFNHYNDTSNGNFHILHMHKEQFPYRRIGGVGVNGQFQDENNEKIQGDRYKELLHRNPELNKIPAVADSGTHESYLLNKVKDPNLSKEELDELSNSRHAYVRLGVAEHKNASKEHFDKLSNDKRAIVKGKVAALSPHKEHFEKLTSKDQNPDDLEEIKKQVAHYSPYQERLNQLINDDNPSVRIHVGQNRNARKEHLEKILNDKSLDYVFRQRARDRLEKGRYLE